MGKLSPEDTAEAAQVVYNIKDSTSVRDAFAATNIRNNLLLSDATRFEATAGSLFFKYKSGFGVIAKGTGTFSGDAVLIVRGTSEILRDLILTDGNVGLSRSVTGKSVHSGLNNVFNSFVNELSRFFSSNNPSTVHCIGHSLGGGLATLAADWISYKNFAKPVLYTFGSPRVGTHEFSQNLTLRMRAGNIYRAYHKTDVVSMVPLWPFIHVPTTGTECFLDSPGSIPGIKYHAMTTYIHSVRGVNSWDSLRKKEPVINMDKQVENWLASNSPLTFSVNTLSLINSSIIYVLKKILHLTGITLQAGITTGLTFIDQLSVLFSKAIQISKELGGLVISLVNKILNIFGKAAIKSVDVTTGFIRWVLQTLSASLYKLAEMAVDAIS